MPAHSISQVVENLAKHPDGFSAVLQRKGYWPLFPLLELPHREVAEGLRQTFCDFGLSEADFQNVSLRDLVVCALRSESDYWFGLAIRWLADGFPIDETVARVGDEMVTAKRGTQADRHILFRLIRRHERCA